MEEASDNRRMAPARVAGARNRIGALPEKALVCVVSHLDARQAVQTCVLSRRWRDLWRSAPCINATFDEFEGMAKTYEECEVLFKRFVNRLLMLRNPVALDEFRLWYNLANGGRLHASSADANLWIGHALQCNARAVQVINRQYPLQLVPAVFSSEHLKTLRLYSADLIAGFFRQLQMGCPALEDLFLLDCTIMDLDIEIYSERLKVLTLDTDVQFSFDVQLCMSAPSLISVCFLGPAGARLPLLNNMASLKTASVLLDQLIKEYNVDDFTQFLGSFSGVTSLDFCFRDTTLMMGRNDRWCPKFSNLINLTLYGWCLHDGFFVLIVFLQNSPNLKKLTLKLKEPLHGKPASIVGRLEERSFACEQLEIVEIICSEGDPLLNNLKEFLIGSGISSGQIHITEAAPTYWYLPGSE